MHFGGRAATSAAAYGGFDLSKEFRLHAPASWRLWREIHTELVREGQALAPDQSPPFAIVRRHPSGALIAAVSGEIAFKSMHISHLFVAPAERGKGVGATLLATAETYARARRCERVHLETRSEAARGFYEKQGYAPFGELSRYAGDQSLYFLEKAL